jgi:hypothetical protein
VLKRRLDYYFIRDFGVTRYEDAVRLADVVQREGSDSPLQSPLDVPGATRRLFADVMKELFPKQPDGHIVKNKNVFSRAWYQYIYPVVSNLHEESLAAHTQGFCWVVFLF